MSKQIVGTCGNCGGPVSVPSPWMGIIPPAPACENCGATVARHGPVLPMNPAPTANREYATFRPLRFGMFFDDIAANQSPLPDEFLEVLNENIDDLYL